MEVPASVMEEALNKAIEVLIQKHKELGMVATGKWIEALEAMPNGNTGIIKGLSYTEQLVQGRAPGKRPPIGPLQEWAKAKFGMDDKTARGVAFAVSHKIAQEGTTWYQKGGSDLLEVLEDPEVIKTFYDTIGSYLTITITAELTRTLKTVEA